MTNKKSKNEKENSLQNAKIKDQSFNKVISDFKKSSSNLSYEDSLNELDVILRELQNQDIQVEALKIHHIKGKILLDHCEKLLDKLEQDVVNLDVNKYLK